MRKRHKIPFPALRGFIAAPPSAYKAHFDVYEREEGNGDPQASEVAVIDVCGPLTQHTTFIIKDGMLLFPPSYDDIRHCALAAFNSDAKVVVLRIDSPGGDFAGSLELARDLRAMAEKSGKPLRAFTDTMCASAAYALACAADTITLTPSAQVGSVGVWAMLCDETAADKAKGLNVAIVASGERKADRNPHVPITEASVSALQAEVDIMAGLFFGAVTELRGTMGRERLEALQGAQKIGEDAVRAGLADALSNSWEEFLVTATEQQERKPMAKSYEEARAAHRANLAKLAANPDEDGKQAAAEIAEMDKTEEKKAKKAAADADGDSDGDKEAKAAAEEKDKEEAKAKAAAESLAATALAASAASGSASDQMVATLAAELQKTRAEVAAVKAEARAIAENSAKKEALTSRPDFSAEIKASLMSLPLSKVEEACKSWPKIGSGLAGVETPSFTRGQKQVNASADDDGFVAKETLDQYVDRKMAPIAKAEGVVLKGTTLTMGFMTREQAQARLAELEKGSK